MNLYHLRYFVTLAHHEHYTNASEELMITQPSLSFAINSLEAELGVRLFEKTGRNVKLTKYGKEVLKSVEGSLRMLDVSTNSLKMAGAGEGVIELAFLRTLGVDFVPRMLRGFLDENADKKIIFNLSTGSGMSFDLLDGLKSKKYDVVFCSKFDREPLINFTPIATRELVIIVPTGHPLAEKDSVYLEETLPYQHIFFKHISGLRHIVDELFFKLGKYPNIAYEVEEDQVVAGLVAHGFGVAAVPRMDILANMNIKTIEIKSPQSERYFYIATLKKTYRAPVVDAFVRHVIEQSNLE